jgi:Mn-dependent DtxR family transcriptional regulator
MRISQETYDKLTNIEWLKSNANVPTSKLSQELDVSEYTVLRYYRDAGMPKARPKRQASQLTNYKWLEDNKHIPTITLSKQLNIPATRITQAYKDAGINKPIFRKRKETREYIISAKEKLDNPEWLTNNKHLSYKQIARKLNVGINMVKTYYKLHNIPNENVMKSETYALNSHSCLPTETLEKLNSTKWLSDNKKRMYKDIANELNTDPQTVTRYFQKNSIEKVHDYVLSSEKEKELYDILSENFEVERNNRTVLSGMELDIYIPEKNLAVEYNGSYWHSELQGKGRTYHINKTIECNKQGIHLVHVWDYLYESKKELVISRLKSKLGTNSRLYARKCDIAELSYSNTKAFLNRHHIQGSCASSVNIGLYHQMELVAVMTFGKSRYDKNIQWELIRYCSKQGINVVGGASKLFKYFTKTYNPASLISYSDKSWNTGGLYSAIGFEYSHSTAPAYYYTRDYVTFENRVAYQKHKLKDKLDVFDPKLTEWENMKLNGYDRIWDCGTDVYYFKVT